ncbi:MAG: F0F1 ATP synthase subunit gamma [Candidatus Margulisbacteria bacterium]|nr:F0F1 ATP synthase subunit gamma [Candidatus Margulisiibacteriota bacterium]
MSQLLFIKERIKSITSIYKVTQAMELVTKTKVNKIRQNANCTKNYHQSFYKLFTNVANKYQKQYFSNISKNQLPPKKYALVFLSQKGFCGNFNEKVLGKLLIRLTPFDLATNIELYLIGKKTSKWTSILKRPFKHLAALEKNYLQFFQPLIQQLTQEILSGENIEVYFIYNEFFSVLQQTPTIKQYFPLEKPKTKINLEFIFEPTIDNLFKSLLKSYFESSIEQVYCESLAGEYCSRLINMKNANDNASIMLRNLNLLYNKTRQMKITQELSEIVSAFDVLKLIKEKQTHLEV